MKKLLSFAIALMAVMTIHAQEICVFNSDNELNLNDEIGTAIDAGTIIGQTESIVAKIGADDTYRPIIRPFVIEGTEYRGGLQGSTNPKDAEGVAPNLSLKQPTKGAFLKFEAKADGFLYVIINAPSHKAYTVFKDGIAIGYTFAAYGKAWPLQKSISSTSMEEVFSTTFPTLASIKLSLLNRSI